MINILVVDCDKVCRRNIKYWLGDEGYSITSLEYLNDIRNNRKNYDLILLGNHESLEQFYIKELKDYYKCSVIIMSKAAESTEIVKYMKLGADDFVLKPIREVELMAKVKFQVELSKKDIHQDEISGVVFDNLENAVIVDDTKIQLTKNEYRLCKLLAKNHLVTMTKERLYESIYEWDTDTQIRTITEYIYSLRRKFKEVNINPIKTVWGTGYRWAYDNK